MKIVCSSDWHGDWSTLGVARFDEVRAAVGQTVDHAIAIGARAYLFGGDLADPDTGGGTFAAIGLALEAAHRLSAAGIASVWIAGNHDVCEDGSGRTTLAPLAAASPFVPGMHVAERPCAVALAPDLSVLCLPFVAASHGVDIAEAARSLWPASGRVIVLSHLTIAGVHPGEETLEMPRGREVLYPFAETARAVLRLQGHYHQRQLFEPGDGGPAITIPGALARLTFGEEDREPAFLVCDV